MGDDAGVKRLSCVREVGEGPASARAAEIRLRFGLSARAAPQRVLDPLEVRVGPGRIIAFVGPSGSGKSTALRLLESSCPGALNVAEVGFPGDCPVVDAVATHASLDDALALLSAAALSEAPLWVRRFDELSDGERFRARLARALGLCARGMAPAPLVCDEFCSGLHRRVAKAAAYNLRKLVTRRALCLVVASSNDDVVPDLQADTVVRLLGRGRHRIEEHLPRPRPISFRRRLRIEEGCKADYEAFASMHYRATDELGFVDRVFVLREPGDDETLGVVVYAYGPIELSLRNQATDGRFRRDPRRLNREVRILRRLVIHPDVRGCGLGHYLVRRTLPRVGTPYVECLAAMGAVNPVFERAGMTRVGVCPEPPQYGRVVDELKKLGVDPFARDFVVRVCRRPGVRALVTEAVARWYQATTGGGWPRAQRQSPQMLAQTFCGLLASRPVYYLWHQEAAWKRAA